MTCGIYCVTNIATGDRYIGQSRNIERRVKDHGVNRRSNLTYKILQVCSESELNEAEWNWVVALKPELNRAVPASDPVRGKIWQNPSVAAA